MKIKLTKSEIKKLMQLSKVAQNTPCFGLTSQQVLSDMDFASMAYERVNDYWKELAKKYKFKIENFKGINEKTGIMEA